MVLLPQLRAKQRKDIRYEETRGDWYTDRKHWRQDKEELCKKGDKSCESKTRDKGEKYNMYESIRADKHSKQHDRKLKGETKKFQEKVSYAERHFRENERKNW